MTDVADLSAAVLAGQIAGGALSAVEVTRGVLDRIAALDGEINACTEVLAQAALRDAAVADARVARGEDPGPLAGVPFVVKNLFDIEGLTTLAGARMRLGEPPPFATPPSSDVYARRGAVLVAATNMDEFAYGFTTENQHFGTTLNPRDKRHVAGGSSGGAAAAVAAGMAHIGLGSDTNGSIRIPAAFSGVFGLKPTFGRLSRQGTWPFVASLDHVGPMTRSVADLALAYDLMQGPDAADPACAGRAAEPVSAALEGGARLRVGVLDGWFRQGAADCALEAVDAAARCLGGASRVDLPQADIARAAAFVITASEGANLHLSDLRARPDEFDPAIRDRLLAGALLPAAMIIQAQRFRTRFQAAASEIFKDYDVLLAPATPGPALAVGQRTLTIRGVEMLARAHIGIYTQPLSFVGLPIIAAPIPQPTGLPVGVQIVAAPWRETAAFQAAALLERAGLATASAAS